MSFEVIIPPLEEVTEEVVISTWHKNVGDPVAIGEPLLDVETAKATLTIEVVEPGYLAEIFVQVGEQAEPGQVIARIDSTAEITAREEIAPEISDPLPTARPATSPEGIKSQDPSSRPYASPKARRLAAERGISLSDIAGSGPDGLITSRDLPPVTRDGGAMRQAIARRMVQASRTIPHFFLSISVDMENCRHYRQQYRSREGGRKPPTYSTLMVHAIGKTLQTQPRFNVLIKGEELVRHNSDDVGLAVALPNGLLTPVIQRAGQLEIQELDIEIQEAAKGARRGQLTSSNLGDCAITFSNLGMYDIDAFAGIINPPGTLLLAAGQINEQVVPRNEKIVIRSQVNMILSVDHRAFTGAEAAEFLQEFKSRLESPLE